MRARILKEAAHLFARQGVNGTSLDEIARAVGIRKPSLLYHFPSKDELRRTVLEETVAPWNRSLPRLLMGENAGEDRLDRAALELVAFFAEDTDRARLLLREALDRPQEVGALFGTYIERWIDAMVEYLERRRREGHLREDVDVEAFFVSMITLAVSSIAISDLVEGILARSDRPATERLAEELLRIARTSLFRRSQSGVPAAPQRPGTPA